MCPLNVIGMELREYFPVFLSPQAKNLAVGGWTLWKGDPRLPRPFVATQGDMHKTVTPEETGQSFV